LPYKFNGGGQNPTTGGEDGNMGGRFQAEKQMTHGPAEPIESLDRLAVKPARAAALLDCSRTKIYDAINAGELRAVHVAGMLRIPMSEIRRHLETSEQKG
jgi:excisionase family DNA binding protein